MSSTSANQVSLEVFGHEGGGGGGGGGGDVIGRTRHSLVIYLLPDTVKEKLECWISEPIITESHLLRNIRSLYSSNLFRAQFSSCLGGGVEWVGGCMKMG